MMYKDRVILVYEVEKDDFLDKRKVEQLSSPVPCMENTFTKAEQMGLFGKFDLSAFKLHLQGNYSGFHAVVYKGVKRKIKGTSQHKNSTVVYV